MTDGIDFALVCEEEKSSSGLSTEIVVDCRGLFGVTTIQEALKIAKDGDCIKVMPGNYFESVFLSKRISLIGCPSSTEKCIITSGSQATLSIITRVGDHPRITIRGIQFECWNGGVVAEALTAAVLIRSGNIHFSECTVIGGLPTSIVVKGDTHSPPTAISFLNCTIRESRGHGISVELCHSVSIKNCIFSDVHEAAILSKLKSAVFVEKGLITGCSVGAYYTDSSTGGISECTILDCKKSGIVLQSHSEVHVQNNKIENAAEHGISLFHTARGCIEKNTIKGNMLSGIEIVTHANPIVLSNKISDSPRGIVVGKLGQGRIEGNEITGYEVAGVEVHWKGSPIILRNKIDGRGQAGILLDNQSQPQNIEANDISQRNHVPILKTPQLTDEYLKKPSQDFQAIC